MDRYYSTPKLKAIHAVDIVADVIVTVLLLALLVIGIYCVWDNAYIESNASSAGWTPYKPAGDDLGSFEELQAINPDVIGWIEIYGTNIDYPLLYSENSDKYLTRDARGRYSLTGSIFLDGGCSPDFSDLTTIIYGHHMDRNLMFGPIDDFKEHPFFAEHRYGKIMYNGEEHGLDIWCLLETDAYDKSIYRRGIKDPSVQAEYLDTVASKAIDVRPESKPAPTDHIALLSTCIGGSTNGRTLLAAKITPDVPENPFKDPVREGTGIDPSMFIWYVIVLAAVAVIGLIIFFVVKYRRRKADEAAAKIEDGLAGEMGDAGADAPQPGKGPPDG